MNSTPTEPHQYADLVQRLRQNAQELDEAYEEARQGGKFLSGDAEIMREAANAIEKLAQELSEFELIPMDPRPAR